jgi:hypothetical protein
MPILQIPVLCKVKGAASDKGPPAAHPMMVEGQAGACTGAEGPVLLLP